MENCVFCKIIAGEIPSKKLFEDELCVAIYDAAPAAKVHVLVMPKRHVASLSQAAGDAALLGHLMAACARVAKELDLADGYRVATNVGAHGGQTVPHLHLHVLGGEQLGAMA